jgi:hypothetical protein
MTKTASPQKDIANATSNGKDGGTSTMTTSRQYQMAKTAHPQRQCHGNVKWRRRHLHKHNAMATAEAMLNRNDDGISAKTTPWG